MWATLQTVSSSRAVTWPGRRCKRQRRHYSDCCHSSSDVCPPRQSLKLAFSPSGGPCTDFLVTLSWLPGVCFLDVDLTLVAPTPCLLWSVQQDSGWAYGLSCVCWEPCLKPGPRLARLIMTWGNSLGGAADPDSGNWTFPHLKGCGYQSQGH